MTQPRFAWRLAVLGIPQLHSTSSVGVLALERKTAALLAYLALEGPTPRGVLAELLWPETPAGAARNNLVHLLRRLRDASGEDLVEAGESLSLAEGLTVDVREPPTSEGAAGPTGGRLLDTLDFDDVPDLAEWVEARREELAGATARQFRAATRQLTASGAHDEATALAEQWVELEPYSEDAYANLMLALYERGDRPAALRAYKRCKTMLRREFGAEPSADTYRLAHEIDLGTVPTQTPSHARVKIPLSVLRPPTLVGREDVWAQMEEAWARGLGIMIDGEAGSGKSRLAQDFLRSKTDHQILFFQGRPGDADVPYATHARNFRQTLAANPDLNLPPWVVRELARMIPELGEAPPPMQTETDKRLFYEAQYEVVRLVAEKGPVIICTDDVQYMDEPSIEAGAYVGSRFWGDTNTMLRCLYCHRTGQLPLFAANLLDSMYAAGVLVSVSLSPLSEAAVTLLLADLDVPGAPGAASAIAQATNGNVQFVLETVKDMVERGDGEMRPSAHMSGVNSMIGERLARLSINALHAARAAAILRREFTLELVAGTLGIGLLDTATAWEELEDAQIVSGEAFSHDLVLETVLASTPPTVRRVLHRSAARVLAASGAPPARVAGHHQEGGDFRQAAPWLVRAGDAAVSTLHFTDAYELYTAAERAYQDVGDESGVASVRLTLRALMARTEQTAS